MNDGDFGKSIAISSKLLKCCNGEQFHEHDGAAGGENVGLQMSCTTVILLYGITIHKIRLGFR